jgi:hypothetical protein
MLPNYGMTTIYIYIYIYIYTHTHTHTHTHTSLFPTHWAGIAQSVQRMATGWKVQGLNSAGGEVFRTPPDHPRGPLSLLYNG